MDQLVQHCMRELSYDGDFGCSASRLSTFIESFYDSSPSPSKQLVDDAFVSYVWKLVVRQPGIRVGLLPLGVPAVWVAPQGHKRIKGVEEDENDASRGLHTIHENVFTTPLHRLKGKYGDRLHIASDPKTTFAVITGSHSRPSKLSGMAYTALQLITRSRDKGIVMDDIAKTTGYSSGTAFYVVKVLQELNLVLKLRTAGQSMNIAIHRHFWERSPTWQRIHAEELEAADAPDTEKKQSGSAENEIDPEEGVEEEPDKVQFDPIDSRYLSSAPLIRGRIIKLLKSTKNSIHAYPNLLLAIGCINPSRTDRRFFIVRIREMIADGIIEKVYVPAKVAPGKQRGKDVLCARLISESGNPSTTSRTLAEREDAGDAELEQASANLPLWNVTIHRQILALLEEAGQAGMTLNAISDRLGHFDKRTMEHLLMKFANNFPPPHLLDFGVVENLQHYGRERRHHYWTIPSLRSLFANEGLEADSTEKFQKVMNMNMSRAGGFAIYDASDFHDGSDHMLGQFVDNFNRSTFTKSSTKRPRPPKNPVRSDGTIVTGRPRKEWSLKRTAEEAGIRDADPEVIQPTKKRTRTKIAQPASNNEESSRKRGRQSKQSKEPQAPAQPEVDDGAIASTSRANEKSASSRSKAASRKIAPARTSDQLGSDPEVRPASYHTQSKDPVPLSSDLAPQDVSVTLLQASLSAERMAESSVEQPQGVNEATTAGTGRSKRRSSRPVREQPVAKKAKRSAAPSAVPSADPSSERVEAMIGTSLHQEARAPGKPTTAPIKKKASVPDRRINVTSMRRQNEILRILKEMGGCANMTTQELQDNHTKHLAVLAERGEHTSAPPGTLIDKRTLKLTIDALEDRGSIKKTTAMVRTANGSPKPSIVISLPDLDPEVLKQYIISLDGMLTYRPPGTRRISDAVEYGITVNQRGRPLADQMPVPKRARLDEASDPDDIRKLILGEQRVIIQSAGFLLGRFARARELHMFLLSQMEDNAHQSQRFVSTNNRIFEIKYLWEDIPVGMYCAINSVIAIHEPLIEYLSYESNRWVPCGNIPDDLKEVLGVGRAKSRKTARSMLDVLILLEVLTPLTPSTSSTPLVSCAPNGTHPASFDLYTDNAMMPLYGMFNEKAPIYLFQLSEESPPLGAIHDISTAEQRSLYWQILHDASNISTEPTTLTPVPNGPIFNGGIEFIRSIRKPFSWISSYALSPLQSRFLTSLIDASTGANPVEDEGVLDSACYVTGAPPDTIRSYLESQSEHTKRALRRIARRENRKVEERDKRAEAKRILTSKALEAKQRVERIWVELLNRVHPTPLTAEDHNRLSTIHQSFVNSAGRIGGMRDENKLKTEILAALEAGRRRGPGSIPAEVSARLRLAAPRMAPWISGAGKVKTSAKSVYDLVQQQRPREPILRKPRKGRKGTVEGTGGESTTEQQDEYTPRSRRGRFVWNEDYDELARDAGVVIQARCRQHARVDWSPLAVVFPGADRNNVRSRIRRLLSVSEAYTLRLEKAWTELWIAHRGTVELPDDDPDHTNDFDILAHIAFLRRHIDKNAIRGLMNDVTGMSTLAMPSSVSAIYEQFDVSISRDDSESKYEFFFNTAGDETREKTLRMEPFVVAPGKGYISQKSEEDSIAYAKALIKMTISTPEDVFDGEVAENLLKHINPAELRTASHEMRKDEVLALVTSDTSKPKPGRAFKYQDWQTSGIYGLFPKSFYRDAVRLEDEVLATGDIWNDWSLSASDGNTAAFLQLISDNRLELDLDLPMLENLKIASSGNSRKLDDDHIECTVLHRLREEPFAPSPSSSPVTQDIDLPKDLSSLPGVVPHRRRSDTQLAACGLDVESSSDGGLVDCEACLQLSRSHMMLQGDAESSALSAVLDAVTSAGPEGVPKQSILVKCGIPPGAIDGIIRRLCSAQIPLAFWGGYKPLPVLVAAQFAHAWAARIEVPSHNTPLIDYPGDSAMDISERRIRLVLPRRWRDIYGNKLTHVLDAAQKAVLSWIWGRPGISEWDLSLRIRLLYDRQELRELLAGLSSEGYLKVKYDDNIHTEGPSTEADFGAADEYEARRTYWFVSNGGESWYRI